LKGANLTGNTPKNKTPAQDSAAGNAGPKATLCARWDDIRGIF